LKSEIMPDDGVRTGATPEFVMQLTSHQSLLYSAIASLLGGVSGVQDVLQETNVALLEKAGEYDVSRPFAPWAISFARFQAMSWRKRQSRDRLVLNDDLFAAVADRLAAEPTAANRRLDALEKCLHKLPGESRRLVDLRYIEGYGVQDIAARVERSANVVSVTLFRIRKLLVDCVRARLAAEGAS
jgi:RNA polymerase sigma-70 factor (ECF subfamily)